MARPLRIERAGAWYHITARGNERKSIYRHQKDYLHFCELLGEAVERFRWHLHGYVLMPNHYHLLLETSEANLSASMQWLSVSYSVWFNLRHQRSGHLFQGRFKSIVVDPVGWGLALSRYVHLNPVRISRLGLDKSARAAAHSVAAPAPDPMMVRERIAALRQFPWSSYRAYVGLAQPPPWLQTARVLELAGRSDVGGQKAAYRRYTEEAIREGLEESPWEQLAGQVILGTGKFLRQMRRVLSGDAREQRSLRQLVVRPRWEAVVKGLEAIKGEKWEQFENRHGDWRRDLALYLGRKRCQLKLGELGRLAGGMDYASVAAAVRRLEGRIKREKRLARAAAEVEATLVEANE